MAEIFRDNIIPPQSVPEAETKDIGTSNQSRDIKVEVPYTEYKREHAHPYLVDHFSLGNSWDDPDGGFYLEVNRIEDYLQTKIRRGEIANSTMAIKGTIKSMEKFLNLKGEERAVVKLPVLAAHIEFLTKTDNIKRNLNQDG